MSQGYTNRIVLIVLDGVGVAAKSSGNAITLAQPTNLIKLWNGYPHTYLNASSDYVGLPSDTNGNSEVGHLNIGAGRIMYQNLPKINKNIQNGNYYTNITLEHCLSHALKYGSNIHLMGCFSDGSVHAHIDHFVATIDFFLKKNFSNSIYVHAFTDGRDAPPKSAAKYFTQLQQRFAGKPSVKIATICGRAWAMDRNENWKRTKTAYDLLFNGIGSKYSTWQQAVDASYSQNILDEYFSPSIIPDNSNLPTVRDNDVLVFLNFRADRAVQLSRAIADSTFSHFPTQRHANLFFTSMVEYEKGFPDKIIYPKEYIKLPLGRIIAENGYRQLRIAESEKFPHVTYFFNGGMDMIYNAEDRREILSPDVATYDMKPEMSAYPLSEEVKKAISTEQYNFITVNYANGDMVAHTGNLNATIQAVKVLDVCIGQITEVAIAHKYCVIITSDHGNSEELINLTTGEIDTEHSKNPVPFIIVTPEQKPYVLKFGSLCDVAPTILHLYGITQPSEMTGQSLITA